MSGLIRSILTSLIRPMRWLSSKANRARLTGARVEVIACMVCRLPEPSILLAQSPYHNMWMPPQEGVNLKETFQQALRRCLQVECGINMPVNPARAAKAFQVRSIRYIGKVPLPKERRGERPIADDIHGTWLESVTLRQKAYWMATIVVSNQSDLSPKADGKELLDFAWYTLPEARRVIAETNHAQKARLLLQVVDACERDLRGAARVLSDDAHQ
ncbi:NUDIX domain-containing protein [Paraburkholderia sp. SIMBA_050]